MHVDAHVYASAMKVESPERRLKWSVCPMVYVPFKYFQSMVVFTCAAQSRSTPCACFQSSFQLKNWPCIGVFSLPSAHEGCAERECGGNVAENMPCNVHQNKQVSGAFQ